MAETRVAVVGATGGIGGALVAALAQQHDVAVVYALARTPQQITSASGERTENTDGAYKIHPLACDITNEAQIESAFASISQSGPLDLCIVATGLLHGDGFQPEKDWRQLDAVRLARSFEVNTIGPALVAKHALPTMRKDGGRAPVFAAISARVGSISDNRLGGWYGYRASKAALNMVIACLAIEARRKRNPTICIGLHPGTVDTALSDPFQRSTRPGQVVPPATAANNLLRVIANVSADDNGTLIAWDGVTIPF